MLEADVAQCHTSCWRGSLPRWLLTWHSATLAAKVDDDMATYMYNDVASYMYDDMAAYVDDDVATCTNDDGSWCGVKYHRSQLKQTQNEPIT
jgi:hypothetical protein